MAKKPKQAPPKPVPQPAWVTPVVIAFMIGLGALFILGLRDLAQFFLTGEACMGRHCDDWATEPGGFVGKVLITIFYQAIFAGLLAGCFNILKNGLTPLPDDEQT